MSEGIVEPWGAVDGWTPWLHPGPSEPGARRTGVRIRPSGRTALATLVARPGADDALSRVMGDRLGLEMPESGRWTQGDRGALVWSAPRQWLLVGHSLATRELAEALADIAAVTDQTDGRALIEVGGADARDALSCGFAIDLHPHAFPPGSSAATKVAHVGVQIWLNEADAFTISVPRSFTQGFCAWLQAASKPYGYAVEPWS